MINSTRQQREFANWPRALSNQFLDYKIDGPPFPVKGGLLKQRPHPISPTILMPLRANGSHARRKMTGTRFS